MACVAAHRVQRWALPLGRFRAPDRGWLVIRGRRGHYEFCDELGVYDVATGAAHRAKSCSGLHLRPGGSVDHEATNAARRPTVESGRLDVANLREAVWMIVLAPEAERVFLNADYFPLPKGVVPTVPEELGTTVVGGGFWGSSSQTRLQWSWLTDDGQELAQGSLDLAHQLRGAGGARGGPPAGCRGGAAPRLHTGEAADLRSGRGTWSP